MKRRTANFIMRQNGEKTGLFSVIDRKKAIIIGSCVLAVLILGGLYLWYVRNYANARKVKLEERKSIDYEWVDDAAQSGIVKEFLWSRTKELMLTNSENKTLIVDKITLPGKLIDQVQEESGNYSLYDQSLLLKAYVRDNDRIKAMSLVSEINKTFDIESESVRDKVYYLDAFMEYYSAYGSKSDSEKLTKMVDDLFDENGTLKTSEITVSVYKGQAYVSSNDVQAALETGKAMGELEASNFDMPEEDEVETKKVDGVLLSSVDLLLIRELENNGLLPEGSYDRNLAIVMDAAVSPEIPLYAFSYSIENGSVEYVFSAGTSGTINVEESIETMRNLALVGELPDSSYSWLKTTLFGTEVFNDTYFWTTERTGGTESFGSYCKIAQIAIVFDDRDMFDLCMERIGRQIATLDSSPALSMVFRTEDSRNVVYAEDNLEIYLIIR